MFVKKVRKVNHIALAKFNEKDTLKKIKGEVFGEEIVQAFFETKSQNHSQDLKSIFNDLEGFRKELLALNTKIDYSLFEPNLEQEVGTICKKASSPQNWCEFFFLVSHYINAKKILEIGTNLGVSGQYYLKSLMLNSKTDNDINLTTIEGIQGLCDIAETRFKSITPNHDNFNIICGLYDDVLPAIIETDTKFDLIFIDGNHTYDATLRYYKMLLSNVSEKAIIIFDDINWSPEMIKVWQEIKKTDYSYSIDFFKLGLIIIDKTQTGKTPNDYNLFVSL
ncbi:O-methyltransferase [Algibacter miyuki]|uniref:O-methyltransferase n=1 Tax=Algibacter miyuki TaxID=1306933 RepID=A0ABV5H281_9FLAO|nr:class I SAM-dependent methyltransferase [Algibacter miyuki]MDN3664401.1 class I SAM-dependent methyltransferase [Algibacter miyuki]